MKLWIEKQRAFLLDSNLKSIEMVVLLLIKKKELLKLCIESRSAMCRWKLQFVCFLNLYIIANGFAFLGVDV